MYGFETRSVSLEYNSLSSTAFLVVVPVAMFLHLWIPVNRNAKVPWIIL